MKTVVFTSDTHNWLLRGFFHQWAKYGNELTVEVAGFTNPGFLPDYATFYSIGKFEDYPVEKWSNSIIEYLNKIDDDLFLFLLEDYWLIRPINMDALHTAERFMTNHPEVGRFDVAADRVFNRSSRYIGSMDLIDICEAKGEYSLSFQASIYRRTALLEVMRFNESPWQSELKGSYRLNSLHYKVVGTYQWPINYMIVMNKGKFDPSGSWMYPSRTLRVEDWASLKQAGCLEMPAGVMA